MTETIAPAQSLAESTAGESPHILAKIDPAAAGA
jgi:hypothetical protein